MHGRTIAEVVETPGRIERLNVGVLVPADADESRYAKVRDLVAVSVGFNIKRGDAIAIYPASPLLGRVVEAEIRPLPQMPTAAEIQAVELGSAKMNSASAIDDFIVLVKMRPLMAGVGALLVLLLFMLLIVLVVARRGSEDAGGIALTDEQREQLLMDLRVWLASDKDLTQEKTA